jgi:hypothetical protein
LKNIKAEGKIIHIELFYFHHLIRIFALNFSSLNSKFILIMRRKYEPDANPSGDGFILFPYTMGNSIFYKVITHAQHR